MTTRTTFVTLPILGLIFLSSVNYAHTAPEQSNRNLLISIPDLRPGFEMSLTALALKPGASNLNYVIYNIAVAPPQSPEWTEKEINQSFGPAFDFGMRYIMPEGKDVSLDWIHLNTTDSTSITAPNDTVFLGPDYEIGPDATWTRDATGNSQFKYDVINLDVGQFVEVGRQVQFRFFGGLSNTYLREEVHARYSGNLITGDFPGPFSTKQKVIANFYGIGPRVGFEGRYLTDYGFGLVGKGAISLLIGSSHAKTDFISSAVELKEVAHQDLNYQTIEDKTIRQVIPGLDGKLGAYYKKQFDNCSILTVEGGYQAAVYVNAINQYLPGTLVSGKPFSTGGIYVATMSHTQSNYSVQGPYLGLALQF